MRHLLFLLLIVLIEAIQAQPNCNFFLYSGDTAKYEACKLVEGVHDYQFSREFHEVYDRALLIDPTFAYAYREKSIAYLKSGDFVTWKKLIDQAVKYDPKSWLYARAGSGFNFFRDYQGALDDIRMLDSLVDYDIGFNQNGDYHLHVLEALCLKGLGRNEEAIHVLEEHLRTTQFTAGLYDHLHLGVLYLEQGMNQEAIEALKKQEKVNDIAENWYYLSQAYKRLNQIDLAQSSLLKAKQMYKIEKTMYDDYSTHMDKVFLADIERELASYSNDK